MSHVYVYEPDGATLIAEVADVINVTGLEELDGIGGGSLQIALTNSTLATHPGLLAPRNVIKIKINGQVIAAWMITKISDSLTDNMTILTASGPGLLAWLSDAIVHQEFPTAYGAGTRYFGWGAKEGTWYKKNEWTNPIRVRARGGEDFNDPANRYRGKPKNWPACDPLAWWVWDRPTADQTAPRGHCYYRFTWYQADTETFSLYLTADDAAEVELDGEPLIKVDSINSHKKTWETEFQADIGEHILGIRGTASGKGGASLLAVMFIQNEDGEDTYQWGTTGDPAMPWVMLPYPDEAPGWTVGELLPQLIGEAETRGVDSINYLNGNSFTESADSDGELWGRFRFQVDVGSTYLQVAEYLRAYDLDLQVDPNILRLNAWQNRGTATDVLMTVGAHTVSVNEATESSFTNSILMTDEDSWVTIIDAGSVTEHGRVERYLDNSSLSARSAAKVANTLLATFGNPTESATFDYVPTEGCIPWVDFQVGDTVTIPTASGGQRARQVTSIAVSVTDTPIYAIELDQAPTNTRGGGTAYGAATATGGAAVGAATGTNQYRPANPATGGTGSGSEDPCIDCDDPEEEQGVGTVSKTVGVSMIDVWETYGTSFQLALCDGMPTIANGEWDITSTEVSEVGYARFVGVLNDVFDVPESNDPVFRATKQTISFAGNSSGADWGPVSHVAMLANASGNQVTGVVQLPRPVTVVDTGALQILKGEFRLTVSST